MSKWEKLLSSVYRKRKREQVCRQEKCISVKIAPAVHMQNNVKRQIKTVLHRIKRTYSDASGSDRKSQHPGALLRMNRSIQAEGTFGIMKNDRWYKRIVRRGIKSVLLEVFLVSIGHNLYKYHNKQKKVAAAA